MALSEKGMPISCHQGPERGDHTQATALADAPTNGHHQRPLEPGVNAGITTQSSTVDSHGAVVHDDGGIDL